MNIVKSLWQVFPFMIGVAACHSAAETEHKNLADAPQTQLVEVTQVQQLQPAKQITLPGELKPWNKVLIFPKVKGFVKTINVDRGSVVKKGQILAQLDAPETVAELSQSKAQLLAAEAALHEQRAKFEANKSTYQRLLQTNATQGAVSVNELEQSRARILADSATVTVAQGNVQAAQSYYQTKAQLVNYLTITAPFDGLITERSISPGALVGPGDGKASPLFVLEENKTLRLTIAIPEMYANQIPQKSEVSFAVNAIPEKQFSAQYARSARSVQEENRSMMAEFDVDNTSNELKAGMYAEVNLPITRSAPTLFVPIKSLVSSSERMFIIRVNNNVAEWVTVQKGNVVDTLVEVFGEVQPGDVIVRSASEELRNGQALQVRQ
ncbi:efflux RND transporter periplasmic adaptor subunit [Rhodocytophaga rosea]|uniref:Efflux RND transporter periplasmic adaptor subunit n=1 Tax=Rhodocytophaga rosea TaxID=2704465 RepID=A0A6C0GU65_9BACT|nr:efflux RND transporter periplasmic adaptor subunit [Rhodocytophaga rosea]QHT70910.1 efflux RND transporter periplasmic adaptor subunit [Rhodocytophaga rosea]